MRWFDGSIPAAIAASKQQGSVFVVVIAGEDEQSRQMLSSWEDESVAELTNNCFVAIKVDAKSETCVQFSQIYPVVCIPSSFFIGDNGIPLEIVAGGVSVEELRNRISKVKQIHAQQSTAPEASIQDGSSSASESLPVHSDTAAGSPSTSSSSSAASKESLSMPMEEAGASGHVTPGDDRSQSSDDTSQASQVEEPLDTKVERITKKLEERQEQKRKGEEESEIKKEIERRKLGKEMLDFKKKQEDDKTKRLLEERNREKAEEKVARDRVKQQIAQDRADRAARYAKTQEEVDAVRAAAAAAALQARQAEQDTKKETAQRERSAIARIQFRLPDGSSLTNQFPSETKLQEARQFAAQEVGNRFGRFSLATMFPRREFTAEDLEKTLLELELAPSASIVLLPQSGRPANTVIQSSSTGGIWSFLGTIFYPLLAVWRFLSGILFTSPPPGASAASQNPPPQQRPSNSSSSSSGEPKREAIRKRVQEKRPEDFKQDGKIYRLRTQEDSEDDNNTWNGNSTQQM